MRIEIQLRSRLQHAWATAVETVDLFSHQRLKSSRGDKKWLRFFALMGSVIAHEENSVPVPETPEDLHDLITELKDVEADLGARGKLAAYGEALNFVEPRSKSAFYFLMKLTPSTGRLEVTGYSRRRAREAQAQYLALERDNMGKADADVVLVSVDSVKSLRSAYPNYYLDTRRFVEILRKAIAKPAGRANAQLRLNRI